MKTKYYLNLLVYPLLQIFFFAMALYFVQTNIIYAVGMVVLSAIFMSFSLHISYHHHVHFRPKSKGLSLIFDGVITVLLGLPFHFYQLQHLNHHHFDNEVDDMTSTYKRVGEVDKPKAFFSYVFLWFLNAGNIKNHKAQAQKDGYFLKEDDQKMSRESLINLVVIVSLFAINWRYALVFGAMFYLGWSMIALHNYGQHLPTKKHFIAYSYYGGLYNFLFMNNGLHYEHHIYPGQNYWELKAEKESAGSNRWIHLLDGIRYIFVK